MSGSDDRGAAAMAGRLPRLSFDYDGISVYLALWQPDRGLEAIVSAEMGYWLRAAAAILGETYAFVPAAELACLRAVEAEARDYCDRTFDGQKPTLAALRLALEPAPTCVDCGGDHPSGHPWYAPPAIPGKGNETG